YSEAAAVYGGGYAGMHGRRQRVLSAARSGNPMAAWRNWKCGMDRSAIERCSEAGGRRFIGAMGDDQRSRYRGGKDTGFYPFFSNEKSASSRYPAGTKDERRVDSGTAWISSAADCSGVGWRELGQMGDESLD